MKVLGLDIGFGHTKCYSEGIKFKFPTQLGHLSRELCLFIKFFHENLLQFI
jgi:hypothetical protein